MLRESKVCLEKIYEGQSIKVLAYARITAGGRKVIPFREALKSLENADRNRIIAFIYQVGNNGFPISDTKFKKMKGKGYDYWEFVLISKKSLRILCYPVFKDNMVILLDIQVKKSNKLKNLFWIGPKILSKN